MPIEIRELVITAVVGEKPATADVSTLSSTNADAIVSACVEQVMEILRQKNER